MLRGLEIWSYFQAPVVWLLFRRFGKRDVLREMAAGAVLGAFLEFATEPMWSYHFTWTVYKDVPPGILAGWAVMFSMVVFGSETLCEAVFGRAAVESGGWRLLLSDVIAGTAVGFPFEIVGFHCGVWSYNLDVLSWGWGTLPVAGLPAETLASYVMLMMIGPTFVRHWGRRRPGGAPVGAVQGRGRRHRRGEPSISSPSS